MIFSIFFEIFEIFRFFDFFEFFEFFWNFLNFSFFHFFWKFSIFWRFFQNFRNFEILKNFGWFFQNFRFLTLQGQFLVKKCKKGPKQAFLALFEILDFCGKMAIFGSIWQTLASFIIFLAKKKSFLRISLNVEYVSQKWNW